MHADRTGARTWCGRCCYGAENRELALEVLTPRVDYAAFVAAIPAASERVLMLDYDGTLAPFHIRPEAAVPYPEVAASLAEIVASGGTRIVVVSGRPARELPPLLQVDPLPEIWGSHGWERLMPDGSHAMEEPLADARTALERAAQVVQRVMPAHARLERKLASIALHWRGVPEGEIERLHAQARAVWEPVIASGSGLELLSFDGGLELRAAGCNKQYAVKTVLSQTGEGSVVAYLGDDMTDEDAFQAVKPRGLAVLVRPQFRPTAADVWLRPPEELVAFMQHWTVKRA
jgi:trehalose 6-phosphate phosphatase